MFLFVTMFVVMIAMTSCTSAETDLSETIAVSQNDEVVIKRLQEYNEVMMAQRPQTRGRIGKRDIACADVIGAIIGMGAGKEIAAGFGIATGGVGGIVTMVGIGVVLGSAYSYQTYRGCKGVMARTDDFVNYSLNMINLNIKSDTMNFYKNYVYEPKLVGIKLPPAFKNLQAVGYMHNQLILGVDYDNPSPQAVIIKNPLEPVDNWNPKNPEIVDKTKILKALNGNEAKTFINQKLSALDTSISNGQFNVDKYIKENPIGNEKVENAIKEYFKLFTTYPENVDDLVRITNDYVEIIESSNEFTDDEKAMIYAGLMVSIYSPQIWDGFE